MIETIEFQPRRIMVDEPDKIGVIAEEPFDVAVLHTYLFCKPEFVPEVESYLSSPEGKQQARVFVGELQEDIGEAQDEDHEKAPMCFQCGSHVIQTGVWEKSFDDLPGIDYVLQHPDDFSWIPPQKQRRNLEAAPEVAGKLFKHATEMAKLIGKLPDTTEINFVAVSPDDVTYLFADWLDGYLFNFMASIHNLEKKSSTQSEAWARLMGLDAIFEYHRQTAMLEGLAAKVEASQRRHAGDQTPQKMMMIDFDMPIVQERSYLHARWLEHIEQLGIEVTLPSRLRDTDQTLTNLVLDGIAHQGLGHLPEIVEQLPRPQVLAALAAVMDTCILDELSLMPGHEPAFWKRFTENYEQMKGNPKLVELVFTHYDQAVKGSSDEAIGAGLAAAQFKQAMELEAALQ